MKDGLCSVLASSFSKAVARTGETVRRYKTAAETEEPSFKSTMTYLNYCGGGTVWDLNTTREGALRDLKMLRDGGWLIADDVRALITEFVLYNPGTSLFALFRGLVEFHPAGTVVPTFNIVAVRSPERCSLVLVLLCPSRPQKGAGTALVRGRETGSTSKREDAKTAFARRWTLLASSS